MLGGPAIGHFHFRVRLSLPFHHLSSLPLESSSAPRRRTMLQSALQANGRMRTSRPTRTTVTRTAPMTSSLASVRLVARRPRTLPRSRKRRRSRRPLTSPRRTRTTAPTKTSSSASASPARTRRPPTASSPLPSAMRRPPTSPKRRSWTARRPLLRLPRKRSLPKSQRSLKCRKSKC